MAIDYKWGSNGGILLDGNGDIAFTETSIETVVSMVRTRLKASVNAWKLYSIGAGLESFLGNTSNAEVEIAIQRQIAGALSKNYLPASTFDIRTLRLGNEIQVYVFIKQELIAQATVTIQAGQ